MKRSDTERVADVIDAAGELAAVVARGLSDEFKASVRRLRIVIAHHYHRVDPAQVWEIAVNECPRLVAELRGHDADRNR